MEEATGREKICEGAIRKRTQEEIATKSKIAEGQRHTRKSEMLPKPGLPKNTPMKGPKPRRKIL